ncbi:L-allo-threonine aldolase [Burkholderia pseudomallei MSHR332]|nr:L-allo-threonine aldolase [Burkholderia pseudomallei MSHR332]
MSGKPIQFDFLSDTVTLPTTAMRQAMYEADVGDDVYGEDPSTNRLESYAADLLGKEAACWLPSGTMANLSAILAQCERGRELFVGDDSDLYNYEAGGVSVVGGIVLHPLATNARGEIPLDALQDALRDADDTQCAPPGIVAIETPHVRTGGTPLSLDYLHALRAFCDAHCLALHIDGARVFNAAIALRVDAKRIAAYGDTLQFCLSKSLAAPAGSIVVSDRDTIARVRRWRKLLGGGMRQIGVVTAAGEVDAAHDGRAPRRRSRARAAPRRRPGRDRRHRARARARADQHGVLQGPARVARPARLSRRARGARRSNGGARPRQHPRRDALPPCGARHRPHARDRA